MNLRKKAIGGLAWQVSNIGINAVQNIIFIMLMARLIPKESFGTFAIVSVLLVFVTFFSEVGIGSALVQRKEYNEYHISFAFYVTLLISTILFGVFYLATPFIASFYQGRIPISVLHFISINLIITSIGVVANALLIRELDFRKIFFSSVISFFLGNLVIGVYLAYNNWGIWALVIAFTAKNFFFVIINYGMVQHSLKFKYSALAAKEIMRYGSGLTISRFFHYIANHADKLIIGKVTSMASLGIYERIQKLIRMPNNYFGIVLNGILFSSFSRVQDDTAKIRFNFFRVLSIVSIIMFYISIYAILFSEPAVMILLGSNWIDAIPVFKVLSFLIFINIFSRFSDTLIRAKDALYWSSLIKFIYCIILVAAIMIGIKWDGLIGAVYLIVIAGFINSFMMMTLSLKLIESNWKEFFVELYPAIKLGIVLFLKNSLILNFYPDANLFTLGMAFLLDLILALGIFRYQPFFFGKENMIFMTDLLKDFPLNFKGKTKLINHFRGFVR